VAEEEVIEGVLEDVVEAEGITQVTQMNLKIQIWTLLRMMCPMGAGLSVSV
jgi:hypothetical protein